MLPGAPHLARRAGALQLDGVPLAALARRFGTPLYVYSQAAMLGALAAYRRALAGRPHLLCYAMKANANLAVLQTFARAGCGVDIVSGGELARALAAGVPATRIVFSGVGKTRDEMRQALDAGVRGFNVESLGELQRLSRVAVEAGATAPVSLRVNPDVDAGTHPYISTGLRDNKFGIAHDEALDAYRAAAALPGLRVTGIDCHIGSQITQVEPFVDALDRLLDLVEAVEAEGIALAHIDVGGGLGIRYAEESPPAADELVARMLARLDARGFGGREILLEPGRSLVGNAGVLLTEVQYLKPGAARSFCIVDAAMNDLVRPAMYQAWMAIEPCTERAAPARPWDVVGPVCESGDWLGRDRRLAVEPGDVLAVLSAGAYGMTMASNYNTRPRAAEVMIVDGEAVLVRERERVQDLFAGERLLAG
ncbi:MAG: diaminopimelate decarboxylase [Burkholderiaceae bacterium]|jgi:diaminopimelate decarboxylase|nr:diaminopimelate decarboxylase [Burkholderiaceae bacterium]MCP5288080.1 diaminopimelate decarboxylase [Burkholderiaceae bacterium]HMQ73130.1 diaminopimelate decarboxylase [Rubrivivax sp.]